jgi:O-antigen/teichoic acid export membrane protein
VRDFVLATTVSLGLTALGSLAAMLRLTGPIRPQFNRRLFGLVVQRAYPFALLGVLMTIYNRVDGVMLERLLGSEGDYQAGVYAAAYRLLDAGTMFAFLISGILLPLFARMRKTGEDVWPVAKSSWRLLLAVSLTAAVVSAFNAAPLMDALYTESTPFWGRTFAWLMPGFVFNATVYVFGSLLTAENRLRGLNAIALLGVAGNIVLNLIFIPRWQALGAAYATLITQGIVAVAHIIYAARVYRWSGRLSAEAARGLGFAAAIMGLAWAVAQVLPDWRLHFLITAVAAGLLAWAFGLLNPRAILSARASSVPDDDDPGALEGTA